MVSPESALSWTQLRSRCSTGDLSANVGPLEGGGEVVDLAGDERADLALVDPLRELHVRRRVADLESDGEAALAVVLLPDRHHLLRAGHVHRHRLLDVGVLAGGERGLEVQGVVEGRRRDVDGVDVLAREELLVGVGATEEVLRVDHRLAGLRASASSAALPFLELVREQVTEGRHHGAGVLDERAGHVRPAAAAAEESEAHGRVRLRPEHEPGLQDRDARRPRPPPRNSRRPTVDCWLLIGSSPQSWARRRQGRSVGWSVGRCRRAGPSAILAPGLSVVSRKAKKTQATERS